MELKILNNKKVKEISNLIKSQFGCSPDLKDYAFIISGKEKIYIVNRDFADINFEKMRINSLGIYFCDITNDEIRFSIEGSQIIGPLAKDNIIEISEEESKRWLSGENLDMDKDDIKGFVIVRSGDDFLGCGKLKNNILMNFVPKIRRMNTII